MIVEFNKSIKQCLFIPLLLNISGYSSALFSNPLEDSNNTQTNEDSKHNLNILNSKVNLGGYARLDTMLTSFNKGTVIFPSAGLDLYIPSTIPATEPPGFKSNPNFHMHAKQSRIWIKSETPVGDTKINTYAEMDFFGSLQGTEVVSNGYALRLRQFYAQFNDWLVGQAWTSFMDLKSTPETVDFGGPAGQVSIRQPMIRWSKTFVQVYELTAAIENPTTSFIQNNQTELNITYNTKYPDFILKATYACEPIYIGASTLIRNVNIRFEPLALEENNEWTIGASIFGKLKPFENFQDNIIFLLSYGNSLGRYIALGFYPDAYVSFSDDLLTAPIFAGYIGFQHFWCPTIRSTYVYGFMTTDVDANDVNSNVSKKGFSSHVNLMWNPYKPFLIGIEYIWANKILENRITGNMNRVQLAMQFNYG